MRIAIRADSSVHIGTGHIGRTLALAEELRRLGAQVEYICRDLPGQASFQAADRGFPVRLLSPHIPATQAEDAAAFLTSLASSPEIVIVDHYDLGAEWEKHVRQVAKRMVAIDDLANRAHGCDLLVDPSLHLDSEQRYQGKVPGDCHLLLGPAYALLRREFLEARDTVSSRESLRNLLIFFGGTDESNETLKAIEALLDTNLPATEIHVVLGRTNPHRAEVESALKKLPTARLHVQPQNFVHLMQSADLFLGAAGGTVWERACLGVPTLCTATAENQVPTAEILSRDAYHFYLGRAASVSAGAWRDAIAQRCQQWEETRAAGRRSASLVDGRGAEKIAQAILNGLGPAKI